MNSFTWNIDFKVLAIMNLPCLVFAMVLFFAIRFRYAKYTQSVMLLVGFYPKETQKCTSYFCKYNTAECLLFRHQNDRMI